MVSLNDFSSLFVDYYNYYKKYSDLYGDKVIILHQTGHFFEIYDYPVDDGFLCSDIQKVSKIVNINVTRRDKNKDISPKNWLMSGVPLMKLDKYCEIFLQNNYHVIVISQVSKPPNIEREVTHVLSPGTVLNDFNINVENNLVSIYIEKNILMNKELYSAGISIINVATGKSMITNVIQNYEDEKYTDNEIQRILSYYNPVEILVHTKDFYLTKEEIINKYDLSHDNIYINHFIEEKEFTQIPYQNNLLQKVFNFNTMNTPIEELNLERKEEVLLSYVYLLNFIHQHKTNLIDNVERPNELNDENYLILSADSVRQLNVFNNYSFYTGRNQDLFSLLNKTVTQIGTRLYKNRLLYPCLDTNTINERYDIVELLFPNNYYEQIRMNLKRINDFEKSLRKMSLNELNTANFYSDYICYDFVKNTIELIKDNSRLSDKYTSYNEDFDLFNEYNDKINNTYEFSNFGSYNSSNDIEKSLFKKGIYSDIDLLDEKIKTSLYHYELIIKKFSKIIDPKNKSKLVKLEYTEKFCWYLSVTKNRSKVIKKYLDNKKIIPLSEMIIKIKTAIKSRKDKNFLVIARTDANTVEGIDKTINRIKAYEDAGADVIFPEAMKNEKEFEKIRKNSKTFLLANMTEFGKSKLLSTSELENLGYNIVIYPVTTQRLAMKSVEDGLRAIMKDGHQNNIIDKMQTRKRLYELVEYKKYNRPGKKMTDFKTDGHE